MTNLKPIYKTPEGERAVMALYDEALAHWLVPHETLTIPTRYGDTFVIVSGAPDAPPLVLLHGAGTNSAIWAGDVVDYSQHHRVYAIDLPGEAGKSAHNRPEWDSPAYGEWLGEVLAGLHADKPTLIGISQGGWTSLKFAISEPQRVDKLVLISPGGVTRDRMSFILRAIFYSMLGKRGMRGMMRLVYADQPIPAGVEEIMTVVTRNFNARVGVLPIYTDEELRRLTMPTLLLGGSKDALRNIEGIAARLRGLLPRLTVSIIPGGGHALMNTTPHILPFLSTESQERAVSAG